MRLSCILFLTIAMAFAVSARSEDHHAHPESQEEPSRHVHGTHPECPLPKTPMDIVRCAQENHPEVKRQRLFYEQAEALPDAAGQIANPELEAETAFGNSLGDQKIDGKVSLVQPLGLGGTRSARVKEAEARAKQSESDLKVVQADIKVETVLKLHRLRQLLKEKALLDETLETFTKLVSQHRSRPRLTPDQEVSLSVFEMAKSDAAMKRSTLVQEEEEIEHFFHVSTGNSLNEISKALPETPTDWPETQETPLKQLASPKLARMIADHEYALAELDSARAASWPELKVGPMLLFQSDGPFNYRSYGFQLNLEIPLFSLNGGGRAYAHKGVAATEGSMALLRKEENHERGEQLKVYRSAVAAMKEALTPVALSKKHRRLEELSFRGLVSSSLLIEAHRQLTELERSRNEKEFQALRALWKIYQIDGRVFEESL